MKKILILISFVLITVNLYAKQSYQSFDEKVVREYMQASQLLVFGTHLGDGEQKLDGIKYAKKALEWMKDHNMDLNSTLAAHVYYTIGSSMGNDKKAKVYVVKSYETFKKSLGEGDPQTQQIKKILRDFY